MLISEALRWAEDSLSRSGIPNPVLDAEVLLAEVLRRDRSFLYSHPEFSLSPKAEELLRVWIGRRSRNLPVAYILGKKEFWSLEFRVTPAVLIPRPETELLATISVEKAKEGRAELIVEVGCGSGALLVSLARELTGSRFCAIDSSADALWVARQNAKRYGVEGRIVFLQGDLLAALRGLRWEGEVDLVVSNPPYIPRGEIADLPRDIRLYEPRRALDGGKEGLSFYRRLIPQGARFLRPGGWLIVEIGQDQGKAIRGLLTQNRGFGKVSAAKDYQGVERVLSARKLKRQG
jgi:release factor glutamine methyltransferase